MLKMLMLKKQSIAIIYYKWKFLPFDIIDTKQTKKEMLFEPSLGESGLVGGGVTFWIGRIPAQTPLGNQLSFGTQPCYEAPGELRWISSKRSD